MITSEGERTLIFAYPSRPPLNTPVLQDLIANIPHICIFKRFILLLTYVGSRVLRLN